MENGLFFSPCYQLNDAEKVSKKLNKNGNLPNFTSISNRSKSEINRARFNLYSLLLPIHDRKVALQEFVDLSCCWEKDYTEEIEDFQKKYLKIKKTG